MQFFPEDSQESNSFQENSVFGIATLTVIALLVTGIITGVVVALVLAYRRGKLQSISMLTTYASSLLTTFAHKMPWRKRQEANGLQLPVLSTNRYEVHNNVCF